jgi:hypothetical protein
VELAQWGLLIHTLLGQLLKEYANLQKNKTKQKRNCSWRESDGTGGFEISRTLAAFGSISQDF